MNKKQLAEAMNSFDMYLSMLLKISKEEPKVILESCEKRADCSDEKTIENFITQINETKKIVRSYCDFMKAPIDQNTTKNNHS